MRHTSESTIIHKKYYVANWGSKRIGITAILFPPRTPPSLIWYFFLLVFLLNSQHLIAQNTSPDSSNFVKNFQDDFRADSMGNSQSNNEALEIAPLLDLEMSIRHYYNKEFYAQYAEWADDGKGRVWTYLPDVGFAFGLPTVTLSTRQIKQAKKMEKQRDQKLQSTLDMLTLKMNTDIQKLRVLYQKYEHNRQLLQEKMELLNIDFKIFDIYKEGYEKNEIEPLTYLQQKKTYIQSQNSIAEYTRNLKEELTDIYILSKYALPSMHLLDITSDDSHTDRKLDKKK
ncbi:TolC family protein [Flammeovirga aprica]|uniref:TolC family protein n=1 Tax=Flammeovirga aprica JL-4 TaxID=694437 RepID=A0A7X9S1Q1_9BACT|nr:TolC family protein [Flammeovirga aprica]NME72795.1 TolC family protein [Flammeovirga aprica JL-4]